MNPIAEDILMHYGTPRHSGRYPWGSGDNPYQHDGDFLSRVDELRSQNFSYKDEEGRTWTGDTAIAKSMGLSTTEFRAQMSIAKNERRGYLVSQAKKLRDEGKSLNEIADIMGFNNDSSVRALLNENAAARSSRAQITADILKKEISEKGMIDVGAGVEKELGISRERLNEALKLLEAEGYPVYGGGVPQVTNPGKQTNIKVVGPPGTQHKDIYDFENVHTIHDYVSHDDGETFDPKFVYPKSMDSKRLAIRYGDEGGKDKDGVIELRRGVDDLSLGESHYAQVRILVDGTHYLKGMALYSDDLPDGVDVLFNTNKNSGTPMTKVLKEIKNDPDNPFGSLIKEGINDPDSPTKKNGGQSYYYDESGKKQLSLINKRAEEGDWGEWADKLPSQFLSKQPVDLVKRQLTLATKSKEEELNDILMINNPVVKKSLLQSYADDCDSTAVHLNAAALPRQKYQVIIPLTTISDNEVYAPNYKNGETVALIRYPHGGTFEIPILKVNNKLKEGKDILGNTPKDAIGINSKVAERLSGADFDGDTVMIIPCNSSFSKVHIQSTNSLKGLQGFDAKLEYAEVPGMRYMRYTDKKGKVIDNTQKQMGMISNLITDMTIKGASEDELARAVRHSMVVIDAGKHKLNYKQSEIDNDILALKRKYQGTVDPDTGKTHYGASTLISRAKSEVSVDKHRGSPIINPDTGELIFKTSNETYFDPKTGKEKKRTQQSTQMAETKDARKLSSGYLVEEIYADYANKMKSLANTARKELISTERMHYSKSAKDVYKEEVSSLLSKLNVSLKNAPRERQAQLMANSVVKAKKQANPDMTKGEIKKAGQQALSNARILYGARRQLVNITQKEWEAIQAGALSEYQLKQIVDHADIDVLRQYATPRVAVAVNDAKVSKMRAMQNSGYTTAEIAESMNLSSSTVVKYLS